jgi:two-component system chemotaxis sensor kinase CheA
MVPVEQVFNRFPRMMRDLSTQLNKKIKFEMSGEKTELDRTIVDEIGDPLVHLLRNAVDHGLESTAERLNRGKAPEGTVKLSARQQGDAVIIEVSDDGKGIDWARVQRKAENKGWIESGADVKQDRLADLLFRPGFSTADQVTELSGRGVGLDVVRSKITALGGRVTLVSTPGVGTTFTVTLPLTLAVMEALLVKVKGETYALPLASVIQTTLRTRSDFNRVQGQVVTDYLGEVLPVQSLCSLIDPDQGTEIGDECLVVVMNDGNRHIGIGVDSLIGQEEIVVKAMGRFTGHGPGVTGATILGDGRLALILEVTALLQEGV